MRTADGERRDRERPSTSSRNRKLESIRPICNPSVPVAPAAFRSIRTHAMSRRNAVSARLCASHDPYDRRRAPPESAAQRQSCRHPTAGFTDGKESLLHRLSCRYSGERDRRRKQRISAERLGAGLRAETTCGDPVLRCWNATLSGGIAGAVPDHSRPTAIRTSGQFRSQASGTRRLRSGTSRVSRPRRWSRLSLLIVTFKAGFPERSGGNTARDSLPGASPMTGVLCWR